MGELFSVWIKLPLRGVLQGQWSSVAHHLLLFLHVSRLYLHYHYLKNGPNKNNYFFPIPGAPLKVLH